MSIFTREDLGEAGFHIHNRNVNYDGYVEFDENTNTKTYVFTHAEIQR